MSQNGEFRSGVEEPERISKLYADAFGEESKFKRKTPVTRANEKSVKELDRESCANAAAAEGLLSSIFGPNGKGKKGE